MKTNHIFYTIIKSIMFCNKVHAVVDYDVKHYEEHCTQCPYFNGTVQATGIECLFDDKSDESFVVNVDPYSLERIMATIKQNLPLESYKWVGGFPEFSSRKLKEVISRLK